jgi:CRISPR type III-A-associated protein Csm2
MNGKNQQRDQMNPIKELILKLEGREKEDKPITDLLNDRDIFHPEGYASKVMEYINNSREQKVKITSVQLRRVFYEFKTIVNELKKEKKKEMNADPNKAIERAMGRLYRLYAILEYQTNRGVLNEDFKRLMFALFNNIERHKSIEAFEKAHDFLMAMVAYSKKS